MSILAVDVGGSHELQGRGRIAVPPDRNIVGAQGDKFTGQMVVIRNVVGDAQS